MRPRLTHRIVALLILYAAAWLLPGVHLVAKAEAAVFTVTRSDDPPPSGCTVGDCSLREAIIAANSAPGSTIVLSSGTYTLTIPGADNAVTNEAIGDLDIRVTTAINGAGAGVTFVQTGASPGSGIHRIFDNHSMSNVTISHMTIRNGNDVEAGGGGCVRNLGVLTLDSVTVSGCLSSVVGGGIVSFRSLTVVHSTITGNTVNSPTGGVVNGGGIAGGPGPALGAASTVNITDSVISNNTASSAGNADLTALGGGFANTATMTISNSFVTGNIALNVGGGINTATMTIQQSTFSGNRARYDVGAVDNDGTMTINDATFSGNQAGFGCVGSECNRAFAGGVLNTGVASSVMNVNNSTFSGNSCLQSGGGLLNALGTVTISSSTFTANSCGTSGGVGNSDTLFMKDSISANNTGGDCGGTITSQGYNLIETTSGCNVSGNTTGNIIGLDPNLGPLQNNGGPQSLGGSLQTRALNAGSPAINAGNPAGCRNHAGAPLQGDQRGYAKPQQGRCDIGAFETGVEARVVYRLRHPTIGAYLFTLFPSERDSAQWRFGYLLEGICCNWLVSNVADGRRPLFRLFSAGAGEYFFTISAAERDAAVASFGYIFEGVSAYCYPPAMPPPNTTPWFRLRFGNKHIYTIYPSERDAAVALGWIFEGITCNVPAP